MNEIEFLATEVMGWELNFHPNMEDSYYMPSGINKADWNPRKNIAQAMGLLDQFDDWTVGKIDNVHGCLITFSTINEQHKSKNLYLTNAICDAVLKAKGFSDENT